MILLIKDFLAKDLDENIAKLTFIFYNFFDLDNRK